MLNLGGVFPVFGDMIASRTWSTTAFVRIDCAFSPSNVTTRCFAAATLSMLFP